MEMMIKLQLKLTPRRANFAIRTRVLIFYTAKVSIIELQLDQEHTYQVACLLLIGCRFTLL